MAWIVLGDGATVGEWLGPQIDRAYAENVQIPLLKAPAENDS